MMKWAIVVLVLIPALVVAKKCTNPTEKPVEETTEGLDTTTVYIEDTTTVDYPPPEAWPAGKFALVKAGSDCPDFFKFKRGWRYQDTEDYLNGNEWTQQSGFAGKMKKDGFEHHYCTKNKPSSQFGDWQAGNYCIHRQGNKCPKKFQTGSITWDDENSFNSNTRKGTLPSGLYREDTKQYFCCRNDSSSNRAIDLPVTKPFYLYRYTSDCQKVRGMSVTEEVILYDDEDDDNKDGKSGAHPYDSGNEENHRLHYCHYQPK